MRGLKRSSAERRMARSEETMRTAGRMWGRLSGILRSARAKVKEVMRRKRGGRRSERGFCRVSREKARKRILARKRVFMSLAAGER
jgi:hypothetical protein